MLLNADLRLRAVMHAADALWVPSPTRGITRRMLDRDGGEVARATTVVRYEPCSRFPWHEHGGGEELLVLAGTFSDERGDYPAGTYLRNPPGSGHAPSSREGCVLLGKLRQFQPDDHTQVVIDTRNATWPEESVRGRAVLPLHRFGDELVALERWLPGTRLGAETHPGGLEVYVLDGAWADEHGSYPAHTWVRNPPGFTHTPFSDEGCRLFVKRGHLLGGPPSGR